MKRFLIAAALCALAACATAPAQIPAPGSVTEKTVLDEKALLGVELAYKAAYRSAEIAVDAGLIKPGGVTAKAVGQADIHAKMAVNGARLAYMAGNAADYSSSTLAALGAVQAFSDALPKGK